MVQRVATDEQPFETRSSDESGLGRSDSPSEDTDADAESSALVAVPPDGGWGWVIVAASFICNMINDGIVFSGGMISTSIKEEFKVKEAEVALVNSILAGFYLLSGPMVSALANKYGFRVVGVCGSVVASVAFAISYFVPNLPLLLLVNSVIGGIGMCMIYMPSVLIVGFYFEKWRAMATGLAVCGSGVGTLVLALLTDYIDKYRGGWRVAILVHAGLFVICGICALLFRPLKPTRVMLTDDIVKEDTTKRHEEAVLKLNNKLDSGISIPPEMRFSNKTSPHTWMGVSNNTRYPTAEEVFRGSHTQLSRRSSANAGAIKSTLGNGKPIFIDAAVAEKDEQDDTIDNTEPLIGTPLKIQTIKANRTHNTRSHVDLVARPLYREDIFFQTSLTRLPQYTSRTSLGYHMHVTHVPTKSEAREERSKKFRCCPEAVKRALVTLLDPSLFRSPTCIIFALSGFIIFLGFFVPYAYLKERAIEKGMDPSLAPMLVSSIGIANVIGRVLCGMISSIPKVSPLWVNNIAVSLGGIATIASSWCDSDSYQFGYSCIFGLAAACFASLRPILVVEYLGLEKLTNAFGIFLLFQGAGALLGSPIAGLLYDYTKDYDVSFYVAGGFILLSAVICYPIDRISRWEKSRDKRNAEAARQRAAMPTV